MFGNRSLNIQLVKAKKGEEETTGVDLDPDKIAQAAIDVVGSVALATITVIGAVFAFKTASQIAINVTNPRNWR